MSLAKWQMVDNIMAEYFLNKINNVLVSVISVLIGWYQGERIRDGAQGWFPGNYTEEVESAHVRARNLKQRYRLLTFTAAYWESQKKK